QRTLIVPVVSGLDHLKTQRCNELSEIDLKPLADVRVIAEVPLANITEKIRACRVARIHNLLRRSKIEIEAESAPAVGGGFLFQREFGQVQAERVVVHIESAFWSIPTCNRRVEVIVVIPIDKSRQFGPAEKVDKFVARLAATLLSEGWRGNASREQEHC